MSRRLFYILKVFAVAFAIIPLLSGNQTYAQQNISGEINQYAKVTSVGTNSVVVDDASAFTPNDTVLLIQMAGVIITANPSTGYGDYHDKLGSPGKYEFLTVAGVNTGTNTITFKETSLANTYDPKGRVQLVKVRSYSEARVSSVLICAPWDSVYGKGGVLALMVRRKLVLNADIDVSGKGFKGGIAAMSPGDCQVVATSFNFYDASSTASGFKGEGIGNKCNNNITTTDIYPGNAKGKAPSFSGGGGGNGHYSGGGGGSNYGAAYQYDLLGNRVSGGSEIAGCDFLGGAYGGNSITNVNINDGVFMGGGGGASTFATTPAVRSDGGNGGGIIFIVADTLVGNSKNIYANGAASNATVTGNAGSGGGGGGGSVIIQASTIITPPSIYAKGGNGGDNIDPDGGAGGGGGGGLILTKIGYTGTAEVSGGTGGHCNTLAMPAASGIDGYAGSASGTLQIKITRLLFNTVFSSRTGTQNDTICSGTKPPEITGTEPAGGNGIYTYQWQKSYDHSNWTNVPGTSKNYSPVQTETASLYFRRIVTSNGVTDDKAEIYFFVQPAITGNAIGNDNTICHSQDPAPLTQISGGLTGGDNSYSFRWDQSTDHSSWTEAEGTANGTSYDPGILTQTHYYRRIVTSGACADTSLYKTITVLPLIAGNTISSDQNICQGSSFADIGGQEPSGAAGPGSYTYKWITSSDKNLWSDAPGLNSGLNYNPSNDSPGTYYFRRVTISGLNDVCRDTTSYLTLISYPSVTNNTIASPQTICAGATINDLTGSAPTGGNGTYNYQWQSSPDNSTWTPNGKTGQTMTGVPVNTTTYFNRVVTSSVCPASISSSVKITAYPALANYGISLVASDNDVILTGTSPGLITSPDVTGGNGGAPAYSWYVSVNGTDFTDIGVTTRDYQPGNLTVTTWFKRNSSIFPCTEESVQKITVLEQISGNEITGDQYICSTETPARITGTTPESDKKLTGGDDNYRYLWQKRDAVTNTWEDAPGTNTASDYSPQLLNRDTEFRRIVKSGKNDCCSDTSATVLVRVDVMPQDITAGDNITLLPYQFATNLNGSFSGAGEGLWSVVSSDGDPVFSDADDPATGVSKLGTGENVFRWLVSNGKCVAEPVSVTITVPKVSIPEGFSPNNDGHNDYFEISGLEFTTNELVIINTGGAVVYKTKNYRSDDPLKAWYGVDNNGKQLPEGTYYYLLTITGATDISVPHFVAHLSGFVIIRR